MTAPRGTRLSCVLAACVALAALAAPTFATLERDPMDDALDRRLPELSFDAVPFSDALEALKDAAGLNLFVDWKTLEAAGIDKTTPVTFRARGMTARKVLARLLREAGGGNQLTFEVTQGSVEVTTQEEADKRLEVRVYDIRDLQFVPLDVPPPPPPSANFQLQAITRGGGGGSASPFTGNGGSTGNRTERPTPDERGNELAEIIQESVRPEVWLANGGNSSIRYYNGTLIINAPRSVHEMIGTPVKP